METAELKRDFSKIYTENYWGGVESASGKGSDPGQTGILIRTLQQLLIRREIKSVVDLGCGDVSWFGKVQGVLSSYLGVEIVQELVDKNTAVLGHMGFTFAQGDVTRFKIPAMDAVLCRDVLCHLVYEDAIRMLRNVAQSGARWFLSTTFFGAGRLNPPEAPGTMSWYPICLTAPPFSLPQPSEVIVEECTDRGFEDKGLGVWRVKDMTIQGGIPL